MSGTKADNVVSLALNGGTGKQWTAVQCLEDLLRRINAGEVDPRRMLILMEEQEADESRSLVSLHAGMESRPEVLDLLESHKFKFMLESFGL